MDPIDSLSKLMEALRRQRLSGPNRTKHAAGTNRASSAAGTDHARKASLQELEQRIAGRLRGLSAENQDRRASRIFLETVLTWEFGDELAQDARFSEMLEKVESQMRNDPQLSAALDEMIQRLVQS